MQSASLGCSIASGEWKETIGENGSEFVIRRGGGGGGGSGDYFQGVTEFNGKN